MGTLSDFARIRSVWNLLNGTRDEIESGVLSEFVAGGHQHLHSHTNTKERTFSRDMFRDCIVEVEAMEFSNTATECSHTGYDEPIRVLCFTGVVDDPDVCTTNLQGAPNAEKVSGSVVNQGEVHAALSLWASLTAFFSSATENLL